MLAGDCVMAALTEPLAKRIAKFFRMLASDYQGEIMNAVTMMKHTLKSEGLSINDIAIVIENCEGQIEERKYSDTDAEIIYVWSRERARRRTQKRTGAARILRRRWAPALERDRAVLPTKQWPIARRMGTD